MTARVLLTGLCLALAAPAQAQLRTIPAEAKRGEIRHLHDNQVEINGAPARLSPGAQIRDAGNLILMPASLPPGARVKYLLDAQGSVFRVWILSPQEAAQPDAKN
jgi:hypothetical protein